MSFSNKWHGMGLAIILTLLFGVGIAQSATIKCGGGVFFFRTYDTGDGGGEIHREIHFTTFQFTNTSSTTRTISKIEFFDTEGALFFTVDDVGGVNKKTFAQVEFDPVLGRNEQEELHMSKVFDLTLTGVQNPARMVATANGSLVGYRIRIARGFKPDNDEGKRQQEERTRVVSTCNTVG